MSKITRNYKVGDKVKLAGPGLENENYTKYFDKIMTVSHVATNTREHPGYDSSSGAALYDCHGVNLSFYDWELTSA